jgi:hypothetical protein
MISFILFGGSCTSFSGKASQAGPAKNKTIIRDTVLIVGLGPSARPPVRSRQDGVGWVPGVLCPPGSSLRARRPSGSPTLGPHGGGGPIGPAGSPAQVGLEVRGGVTHCRKDVVGLEGPEHLEAELKPRRNMPTQRSMESPRKKGPHATLTPSSGGP